jgi:PD-(D/E)XK nuclease superfamily
MTTNMNKTAETIVGAAIDVYRERCQGLPESAYEARLAYELSRDAGYVIFTGNLPLHLMRH